MGYSQWLPFCQVQQTAPEVITRCIAMKNALTDAALTRLRTHNQVPTRASPLKTQIAGPAASRKVGMRKTTPRFIKTGNTNVGTSAPGMVLAGKENTTP